MSETKILPCDCKHKSQDEMFGSGKRVHNKTVSNTTKKWRCTVCKKEKD